MNDKPITFQRALQLVVDQVIPFEIINEISNWNFIIKSPYGNSFYNAPVEWEYKEEGSLRISNHWNFESKGKKHCETTTPITNDRWVIGKYDSTINKYVILKTIPLTSTKLKNDPSYKLLCLVERRKKSLDHIEKECNNDPEILGKCELGYLNKYFKLLEENCLEN